MEPTSGRFAHAGRRMGALPGRLAAEGTSIRQIGLLTSVFRYRFQRLLHSRPLGFYTFLPALFSRHCLSHCVPGHARLIGRLGVALDLLEAGVAADGGDLMNGAAGVGESRQRRLAQAVEDASLRQPGGSAPSSELIAEDRKSVV